MWFNDHDTSAIDVTVIVPVCVSMLMKWGDVSFLPPSPECTTTDPTPQLTIKWMNGWMITWNGYTFILSLGCLTLQHHPRFLKDSCVWVELSRLGGRQKKGRKKIWGTRYKKNPQHRHEAPLDTTVRTILESQHRNGGLGCHAKDDPGGCCVSSGFLAFCRSSYLPIIVECCWTAASRSLSSIVHSPISDHPEETTIQGHCGQIPPK